MAAWGLACSTAAAHALSTGFIENRGQVDETVRYYTSGSGAAVRMPESWPSTMKAPRAFGQRVRESSGWRPPWAPLFISELGFLGNSGGRNRDE